MLNYGDSSTSTHAYGLIGKDTVNLAGLSLQNQFFAAINDTNTSVQDTGAAGIFGLGFPVNSILWGDLYLQERETGIQYTKRELLNAEQRRPFFPDSLKPYDAARSYLRRTRFPSIPSLYQSLGLKSTSAVSARQSTDSAAVNVSEEIAASYLTIAPFVPRLVATEGLVLPQFTISLQRDAVDIGGNNGMLSIGALPASVSNDSLTWTPLRAYSTAEGGLPAPPDSPNEYPMTWEIFVDDVYLDGVKLAQSTLTPNISVSALLDTGNSLIRGPSDVVEAITNTLGSTFPCDEPHTLAFQIGGKMFPIDPRDFISQTIEDSVESCTAKLASTDPPRVGAYLYSWSLGDPFLKGVIATFHYGNLTYPSVDSPKIGLLSTVPSNAGDLLKAAVTAAQNNGGNFPAVSEQAPSGVRTAGPSATSILQGNSACQTEFVPWGLLAASLLTVLGNLWEEM
ncbi:hypothetical protein H0H92_007951 [Tricholoma furcatifolium]|nr:hypothetical protein H0H92_007951 [Tricholoma furcatifolium]